MFEFLHKKKEATQDLENIKETIENASEEQLTPPLPVQQTAEAQTNEQQLLNTNQSQPQPAKEIKEPSQINAQEAINSPNKQQSQNIDSLFNPSIPNQSAQEQQINNTPQQPINQQSSQEQQTQLVPKDIKISPPLFISIKKYKEIVNELIALKASIISMESVTNNLEKTHKKDLETLKELTQDLETVNNKLKYFLTAFKIKQ